MMNTTKNPMEAAARVLAEWPHSYVHGTLSCARAAVTARDKALTSNLPPKMVEAACRSWLPGVWDTVDVETREQVYGGMEAALRAALLHGEGE